LPELSPDFPSSAEFWTHGGRGLDRAAPEGILAGMFPRFRLLLAGLLLVMAAPVGWGQYVEYKIPTGALIVSDRPDDYFSFEVPGKTITPTDLKRAPHPKVVVDAYNLEIVPVTIDQAAPADAEEEMDVLKAEFEKAKAAGKGSPTNVKSHPVQISEDQKGFAWSFVPFQEKKMVYALAFFSKTELFLLKASFDKEEVSGKSPTDFLLTVAKSFARSDQPIQAPR
jgi:hypothetical protein